MKIVKELKMSIHLDEKSKIIYLQNRNRLMNIEYGLVAAKGKGERSGMDGAFGVGRCKVLYMDKQ